MSRTPFHIIHIIICIFKRIHRLRGSLICEENSQHNTLIRIRKTHKGTFWFQSFTDQSVEEEIKRLEKSLVPEAGWNSRPVTGPRCPSYLSYTPLLLNKTNKKRTINQ
jgi:hypothetical protein